MTNMARANEFTDQTKVEAYDNQGGVCRKDVGGCGGPISSEVYDGHHIHQVASGGGNNVENCAIMHESCHQALHGAANRK
jgi:5-methylcytosine-specific restriction endonuclease McrA